MSERPTPETDAMCICTHHKSFAATGGVVTTDFARRLERERDEWKEQLDAAMMLIRMHQRRETWPNDPDPFTSPDHDNDQNIYQ